MSAERLTNALSPYLRRAALEPVHWHPWNDEVATLARSVGRPVLLSIGHEGSAGCARMSAECFSQNAVAAVLNTGFFCIKVDRDEQPDIARTYQFVLTVLNRDAPGMPVTAFLDPDTLLPFFGGGYFPPRARDGLPGFSDLLLRITETFRAERDAVQTQCTELGKRLLALESEASDEIMPPTDALLKAAREQLEALHDVAEGGFGTGAKFPMPTWNERLLLGWARRRGTANVDRNGLELVMQSLTRMARGGIHDHLGGGFFRYTLDRRWSNPVFQKSLVDNAQLLRLYTDAFAVSGDRLFREVIDGTVSWLLTSLCDPHGAMSGLFATGERPQDDGSAYFTWRRDAVRRLLDEDQYLVIETLYGLDKPANHGARWLLNRRDAWRAVVERLSLDPEIANSLLATGRARLLAERRTRPAPIATRIANAGGNGLAIGALSRAGSVCQQPEWIDAAARAADGVIALLWQGSRLHGSAFDGQRGPVGTLDDHALLLQGLLDLLAARWQEHHARLALDLAETLASAFLDPATGAFVLRHRSETRLVTELRPTLDEALPSGNGSATAGLLKAGQLFGRTDLVAAAERALRASSAGMAAYPVGHAALLTALEFGQTSTACIIVRGPESAIEPWVAAARAAFDPWRPVYVIPWGAYRTLPKHLPRLVRADLQGAACAWWCNADTADGPITTLDAFRARLGGATNP
ncbi:MAG: thioredoxin domain-containing protein [Pseudomonadales bacterium]